MSYCSGSAKRLKTPRVRYLIAFAAAMFLLTSCGTTPVDENSLPTAASHAPLTGGTHTTMDAVTATLPPVLAQSSICSQGSW
ncbi:hypothetical protein LRQ08_32065 (plasmid) [Rhodococcus qingshengii]|uniref:hypothetical protein n=1 Tax=Rhodococcus qingshengii TaxID=334542 RepID=UPI00211123B5|nr:hypothetical protein [Rhodococcus qingshengii]UUE28567.1 hypothetical protein LRQ08_32065 [Rhodococcus qingshengii]